MIKMVIKSVKHLINEDKRVNQADRRSVEIITSMLGNASETEIKYILDEIKEKFFHGNRKKSPIIRLEPLVTRLFIEATGLRDEMAYDNIRVKMIASIVDNLYVLSLNNKVDLSAIPLDSEFEDLYETYVVSKNNDKEEKEYKINAKIGEYQVIGPIEFDEAQEIGNYSCPTSLLCYTQYLHMWNNFTNGGSNACYVMLKDGWKDLKPVHDNGSTDEDGSPYDTYGMSMIFLFVDQNGKLVNSNTRWNHKANFSGTGHDVDYSFSEPDIEYLIGKPFTSVFKPKVDTNPINKFIEDVSRYLYGADTSKFNFSKIIKFENGGLIVINNDGIGVVVNYKGEIITGGFNIFNKEGDGFKHFKQYTNRFATAIDCRTLEQTLILGDGTCFEADLIKYMHLDTFDAIAYSSADGEECCIITSDGELKFFESIYSADNNGEQFYIAENGYSCFCLLNSKCEPITNKCYSDIINLNNGTWKVIIVENDETLDPDYAIEFNIIDNKGNLMYDYNCTGIGKGYYYEKTPYGKIIHRPNHQLLCREYFKTVSDYYNGCIKCVTMDNEECIVDDSGRIREV